MNQKIAILTDSSSSVYKIKHGFDNLFMIDLPCFIGDDVFSNFEKNQDEPFFKALVNAKFVPKTSQPSVGETLEIYERIKSLGFTHIIFLPISKELSGTYANAHLANDIIEGIDVTLVDTRTTASILLNMALVAADMAKKGKSVEDICNKVEELKGKWGYFLTVNDLTALIKNGRLSNAKGFIANVLNIKPIIRFTSEGKLVAEKKVRTFKKAMLSVVETVVPFIDPKNDIIHISYTNNLDDVELMRNLIQERLPGVKIETYTLPATIIAHVGLAAIGIGFLKK